MKRSIYLLCFMLLTLILFSGCSKNKAAAETSQDEKTEASMDIFAMDTYITLKVYGQNPEEALQEAKEEIQRLDQLWSTGNSESEIYQLNKKKKLKVSEETLQLIKRGKEMNKETKGAFDTTIYPLMKLWGFTNEKYHVPTHGEIEQILKRQVGSDKIEIEEKTRTVTLKNKAEIDLGGIAKGYTSQKIAELSEKKGIEHGVISLGGNVQSIGKKLDGSRWKVGIQPPVESMDMVGTYMSAGESVITSGGYERYFEENGKTYHHILDPSTGSPSQKDLLSVTVISKDGTLADSLSTSLFVMGKDQAISYWKENVGKFDVIFVDKNSKIYITEGIKDNFTSNYKFEIIKS